MDDRTLTNGPDKRVPPEDRRGTLAVPGDWGMNDQTLSDGPDKRIPPRGGRDEHVPPEFFRRDTLVVPGLEG
ncbi:hypothetical protein THTE_0077 [Thermogutta terrifontis]|uniref:Uncharacterized protein n=1 Tax=Thermogutta terrifontis TaxID=1331910 RepID=A0A286R9P0_9BACT|nr:hypothetical protein THTE_0077 [Thermogutta terrifontis]